MDLFNNQIDNSENIADLLATSFPLDNQLSTPLNINMNTNVYDDLNINAIIASNTEASDQIARVDTFELLMGPSNVELFHQSMPENPVISDQDVTSSTTTTISGCFSQETGVESIPSPTINSQMNIDHSSTSLTTTQKNNEQLDIFKLGEELKFDLSIPDEVEELSAKQFRMERKSFAIACYTDMTKQDILEHIKNEFNDMLHYVCISSPYGLKTALPTIYIQIILHRSMNKKTYFLRTIAGMQCNYRVTTDDRAWHKFLKRVGDYIEMGQFHSVRARVVGKKTSSIMPQKTTITKKKASTSNSVHLPIITKEQLADQITASMISQMNTFVDNAIKRIHQEMPVECTEKRTLLLNKFKALQALANDS